MSEEVAKFAAFSQVVNTKNAKVAEAVETIRRHYAAICNGCRRTNQDDIRIKRSPHAQTERIVDPNVQRPMEKHDEGTRGITNLPEEVENTLRVAMSNFWGLSPIQLLCVWHMMNRRRLSAFGETLRGVHETIRKYRGSERAQAGMMRDAIAKRIPFLAPIINAHLDADGAVNGEIMGMMDDPPPADLFEAAGLDVPFDSLERRTKR